MKKTMKIISTILLTMMVITSIASVALAAADVPSVIDGVANAQTGDTSKLTEIGGKIVNIIQVAGIIIAIVVILVIGIKYMTGSVEQKAEYKKTMIPYIVGALLLFAGTTIVKIVYNTINGNVK